MSERILVTGGAGFIGSHLVERLVEAGHEVHVVDDLSTGRLDNLAMVRGHPDLHLIVDSVVNWALMERLVPRMDRIYHLAAAEGVRRILKNSVTTITTNVRGTEMLLTLAARSECPVFFASTSEVYGKTGGAVAEYGSHLLGSVDHHRWSHATTKLLDEFLALAYHREQGLPVVIGRIFNTAGPRQLTEWGGVLPSLVARALDGEPLTVFGAGDQQRTFCHVDDTVDAILDLSGHPEAAGEVFNIGSSEEVTILQLAELVRQATGSSSEITCVPYEDAYGVGFEEIRRSLPDTGALRRLTGWEPGRPLREVVRDVVEWMKQAEA